MASLVSAPAPKIQRGGSKHKLRTAIIFFVISVAVACLALVSFPRFWPFTRKSIVQNLGEAADSVVTAQNYRATFFPPGCVLDGVEFRHRESRFITIQKLIVKASYFGILHRHVRRIEAIGAHVYIPAFGSNAKFRTQHSNITVDELVANGAYVEFESKVARPRPFRFDVHEATLRKVRWGGAIVYHLKFHNPNPPGEIFVDGKFGAWAEGHPENTPFSGRYTFQHADLAYYGGIAGVLSSQGQFEGKLEHLDVNGSAVIPDFEVRSSINKVKLETQFNAYVNAMKGDTFLQHVEAHFGNTDLVAQGSIAHSPAGKSRITELRLTANHGRIEDVLGLFVDGRSPMSGDAALETEVIIPPEDAEFQKKVLLDGYFQIGRGTFPKSDTQEEVDKLSAGARGKSKESPPVVLTDLSGQVKLEQGMAHFSKLSFTIPGAKADMHGTYSILNYRINLHGRMRVDSSISKTTSGMKSILLKILDPFFKKRKKGEVVPIHIEGTYKKPQFGLDLTDNHAH